MRGAAPRVALGLHRSGHERRVLERALELGVRAVDTSFNYYGFGSHRKLAAMGWDFLSEFQISTKVGFFPGDAGHVVHRLDPEFVRYGVELTLDDLGVMPDAVMLHNPEQSLADMTLSEAADCLSAACEALATLRDTGLFKRWGISTWRPDTVLRAFEAAGDAIRTPDVVMIRAGLLVSDEVLQCNERLFDISGVLDEGRWGMAPFGGNTSDPIWDAVDPRLFMAGKAVCNKPQAALRVAYELPEVRRVAVGTDSVVHLQDLVMATTLRVDYDAVSTYRGLLQRRAADERRSAAEIG